MNKYVKLFMVLLLLVSLIFVTQKVVAQQTGEQIEASSYADINITINKETTESDLEEIQSLLRDNGIQSKFTDLGFNDIGELVKINIEISSDNGQTVMTSLNNNLGINEFTFGRKDGQLYIDQKGFGFDNKAFSMPGGYGYGFGFDSDSLIKQHFQQFNFDSFFNENDSINSDFFGGLDIQQFMDKFHKNFGMDPFSSNQKMQFVDDPSIEKIIIIDGKESNIESLNELVENNKIEAIDYLKPETAKSIYGDKARDGAIIVTTKK